MIRSISAITLRGNKSSWEAPEKFNPPPPREDESHQIAGDGDDDPPQEEAAAIEEEAEPQNEPQPEEEQAGEEQPSAEDAWVAYTDDEGREYYFNSVTNETTWDKPDKFEPAVGEDSPEEEGRVDGESPDRPQSPVPMDDYPPSDEEQEKSPAKQEDDPIEEKIDPAVQRVKDAEIALTQPDAIMEPGKLRPLRFDTFVFEEPGFT